MRCLPNRLVVVLAGFLLSGCAGGGPPQFPPSVVDAKPVVVKTWHQNYVASGTIEANNKVDMNMEAAGQILQLNFVEGQGVGKGQVLVRLKPDKFNAQVGQAAAQIQSNRQEVSVQTSESERSGAQVQAALSRKNLAESEFKRYQKLNEDQLISSFELEQRRAGLDTAEAEYQAALRAANGAKAREKASVSNLSQAKQSYRYNKSLAGEAILKAPFSGRVGQKYVDVGDYVMPGVKIVTLVDESVLKIKFPVPERYLSQLRTGLPVVIGFEGGQDSFDPTKAMRGSVSFIDPVVDPDNRTVMIKAVISDPEHRLRHGQSVLGKLILADIPNSLVVPEEAILPQGEKTLVYVLKTTQGKDGKPAHNVSIQEVKTGQRDSGEVQILSGLKTTDMVVTSGLQKIFDGAPVMLTSEMPKQAGGK